MCPCQMSRSLISLWYVYITSAARNTMVAPTQADEKARSRESGTSLFIGVLVGPG